jgi:hypothetical protein
MSEPRSRELLARGFTTFDDAWRCLEALVADVIAEKITAHEGNEINAAIHRWMSAQEG